MALISLSLSIINLVLATVFVLWVVLMIMVGVSQISVRAAAFHPHGRLTTHHRIYA
jgi:hypothetical protein